MFHGSVENFANLMNSKATEIGCGNTHFVNPNGIHENWHYSTAYDMALITMYANKIPEYRKIIATPSYTLPITNLYDKEDRIYKNTNSLINNDSPYFYKYCIGGKTGFTSQAGRCLSTTALRDGLELTCVVLGAENSNQRYTDIINLFDYGFDNYTLSTIKEEKNLISTIEVANATKESKDLNLLIEDNITALVNKTVDYSKVSPNITLKENISAPIYTGQVLGTITYNFEDIEYTSNLIAGNDCYLYIPNHIYTYIVITIVILIIFISIPLIVKMIKKRKYS